MHRYTYICIHISASRGIILATVEASTLHSEASNHESRKPPRFRVQVLILKNPIQEGRKTHVQDRLKLWAPYYERPFGLLQHCNFYLPVNTRDEGPSWRSEVENTVSIWYGTHKTLNQAEHDGFNKNSEVGFKVYGLGYFTSLVLRLVVEDTRRMFTTGPSQRSQQW